jgi:hypothetical protein
MIDKLVMLFQDILIILFPIKEETKNLLEIAKLIECIPLDEIWIKL